MDYSKLYSILLTLSDFILVTIVFSILLTVFIFIPTKHYNIVKKQFVNIFYRLDRLSILRLVFSFLYFCFYTSCILFGKTLNSIHIQAFILLAGANILINLFTRSFFGILFAIVLQFAGLFTLNLLLSYLLEIAILPIYLVGYVGCGFGLILFSFYMLMYMIKVVSKGRVDRAKI